MKTGWKGDVNSEWEEESCCEEDNQGLILSFDVIITKETSRASVPLRFVCVSLLVVSLKPTDPDITRQYRRWPKVRALHFSYQR